MIGVTSKVQYDRNAEMTKKTGEQERPESWNDWKVGTTRKLERPESWTRPEIWKDWTIGTTGMLERQESWNNWKI